MKQRARMAGASATVDHRPVTQASSVFAARLSSGTIIVAPGVYDPLSALLAAQAGAQALFVSGAAVAMTQLGRLDVGLTTATEMVDCVARIVDRVDVPVLVDGDQGFGNAAHLQRFVRGLCRAGAAAVQIEDQVAVKRVADIRARPLVPKGEMVGRIKAAQDARTHDGFLISARTDALATTDLNDALDRADAYIDAGCDLLFFESIKSAADADAIVARFGGRVPLVVNLLESGGAPFVDANAAGSAGFALALFPVTGMGAAAHGLRAAYAALVRDGSSESVRERLIGMAEMNEIVGTAEFAAHVVAYGDPA
jgi:2-methylisocitrate lyase-like PEP mutase family enzyme